VTMYFPPAGGGGVQRSLKLAQYLPALGIETHVLAPDDPKWLHRDPELRVPTQAWIHRALLERGVYLAPSQFEAGFVSTAHGDEEIDATVEAARGAYNGA